MNTQNCSEILNLIPSYIDDLLDIKEKDRVAEHINSCDKCRAELTLMTSVREKTKELPDVKISADFHARLMEKAKEQKAKKRARRIVLLRRSGAGVAAAAVVALSVVSFGNLGNTNSDIGDQAPVYSATPTPEAAPTPDVNTETDVALTARTESTAQDVQNYTQPKEAVPQAAPVTDITDTAPASGGGSSAKADLEAEVIVDAAVVCDESAYMAAEITLDDSNREAVMEILAPYEKDHMGYKVPDIGAVLRKIAELGIQVQATDCDMNSNYIIVK